MRKYFGGLVVVLAIAMLVPGTALATHSNGQGPDKDFRHGTHKGFCPTPFGSFPCQVHVSGQSESATGPGVPASGHWFIRIFAGDFLGLGTVELSGEVVCLDGDRHQHVDQAEDRSVEHRCSHRRALTIQDRAIDNGEGSNDPEDESTGFLSPPATTCPTIPVSTTPIEQGNITNHDGI